MQSTRSASIIFRLISPSPEVFEDMLPLASTKPANPVRREMVDEMLHPGKVRITGRRHAVLPPHVFAKSLPAPVADR